MPRNTELTNSELDDSELNGPELIGGNEEDRLTTRLQDLVLESHDVEEFLEHLVRVAAEAFTGPYGEVFCGITLIRPGSSATIASSSALAQAINEVQFGFDEGPCLTAAREGTTVYVEDFLTDTRYPRYRTAIAGHGVRSALGIPVRLDAGASAGLDFYSTRPHAFDTTAISVAERFGRDASRALRLAVKTASLEKNTG